MTEPQEQHHLHHSKELAETLIRAEAIQNRVQEMGAELTREYAGRRPHLIGILKGASVFHADLIRAIDLPVSIDFIAVSSYGNSTTTSGEVRILKDPDTQLEGRDVLLVEDIVDTGLTLNYLLSVLHNREPRSLKVITLLSKPSRRLVNVQVDYIGFEIEDKFVVGYGLDFDQRYRNLPFIACLGTPEVQANGK
jgi:hypoxanthine phosphoribosyltransferase